MNHATLEKLANWAETRINTGKEPPWTEKSLGDLVVIARELARGMNAVITLEDSLELEQRQESVHPQSENIVELDNFRRHLKPMNLQMPT